MATLRDIAEQAGVSIDTVSRVLSGKIKETWPSTARRAAEIRRIAGSMGYVPHAAARAMRTRQTPGIGVLLPGDVIEGHYSELLAGVRDGVAGSGYSLSLVSRNELGGKTGGEAVNLDGIMRERMLAGLVVLFSDGNGLDQDVGRRMIPCVWLDCNHWARRCCLQRDELHAGRVAAEKTIKAGYRRLLLVTLDTWVGCHHCVVDRRDGVLRAAAQAGVPADTVVIADAQNGFEPYARDLMAGLECDVGVIAWNVAIAEWVSHTAARAGKCPGRDFGLACCEDTRGTAMTWPDLSRVTYGRMDLGRRAARMLLRLMDNPKSSCRSIMVKGKWHAGNTL